MAPWRLAKSCTTQADEVGLGERGGAHGDVAHGAAASIPPPPAPGRQLRGQPAGHGLEPRRLVGQRAELLVEGDLAESRGHGREPLGEVAVVTELGVVEAAREHALVAVRDLRRRRRVGVADVEEGRQQLARLRLDREVALVALHRGDQHLTRQAQVALVEGSRVHARPLGQEDVLVEHGARVEPAPAERLARASSAVVDQSRDGARGRRSPY